MSVYLELLNFESLNNLDNKVIKKHVGKEKV